MGVLGLTTLLQQNGWMPKRQGCETSLWRDVSLDDTLAVQEVLPTNSTLAVDGSGLAFYLHEVAYARYFSQVAKSNGSKTRNKKKNGAGDCTCKKQLSQEEVIQCLPQSMPLNILDQVTREFVEALQNKHQMKLVIYWDGDGRRMKAATSKKRRQKRANQWGNLYKYCQFGTLPFRKPCLRNFSNSFPDSRLLMQQVFVTLSNYSMEHIHCEEEADREVAMASAHNINTYCVGMDSDYCLFPDTKYVPFSTLNAQGLNVTGCVITRDGLADLFHLPTSEAMVEMGILMGNDYVGSSKEAGLDFFAETAEEAIDHLQVRGENYRVSCRSEFMQLALDFTRALYSFQPLDSFPMDAPTDVNISVDGIIQEDNEEEQGVTNGQRPKLPASFDLTLATLRPIDFSLREVVARPMEAYINGSTDDPPVMTKEHLEAFNQLQQALELNLNKRIVTKQRPNWRDVLACYAIEKCIYHVLRTNAGSPVVRFSVPMKMFDQLSFECMMNAQREASKPKDIMPEMSVATEQKPPKAGSEERVQLPIDEFEVDILDSIATNRVTIIHGKTGCGKSSRVPVMVLRAPMPDNSMSDVKMFISQPRRIAAKSLVERVRMCEPDIKHKFALRMGHGEREYESGHTRAWFVTTGYLVRLLANHPERFNDVSHLIIDEVHERSVDSDVLCLLCRRLLETNSRIRLVLMSATLAANLYADYFNVPRPPIEVGGRVFPIREFFVEDFSSKFKLPSKDQKSAKLVRDQCEKSKCRAPPSNHYMENLYNLAVSVTVAVGQPGSSVLIFVTGMNDIISIIDRIEKQYKPGVRYTCFPIHSDVPFEEQMAAFDKPAADEIKVVIGTNAAESSITLPDVDHVVCLGLQKQIIYNAASHRQMLTPAWISRANAVQRAGRTGRVRIGNVYRLYTKKAFDDYMLKFELGEMSRVPLDSVILDLKGMLMNEQAAQVLLDCLEPPDLLTIERSFESLHSHQFISEPDDSGHITNLGSFVSSLGVDLMLGSLIGLGIQFGVGPEAIEIAAIMSFAKTPWVISSPLFHGPLEFNTKTFSSRCHFDAKLFSDPLAIMNMLWDYERVSNKKGFGWQFTLALSRVRRLLSTRNSIRNRVADFLRCDAEKMTTKDPPSRMPHAKVVLLRIIQVWVFSDNLIETFQVANVGPDDESMSVTLRKNQIETEHLKQILDPERHPFELVTQRETEQKGAFTPVEENFSFTAFLPAFEQRYLSYCAENNFNMAWYRVDSKSFTLLLRDHVAASTSVRQMKEDLLSGFDESFVVAVPRVESNNRGRNGRACGLWDVQDVTKGSWDVHGDGVRFVLFSSIQQQKINKVAKFLKIKSLQISKVDKTLSCHFFLQKVSKKKKCSISPSFSLLTRGQATRLVKQDVIDLFSSGKLEMTCRESGKATQEVQFKMGSSAPMQYKGNNVKGLSGNTIGSSSSWEQPLLNDVPEGARIMSVLGSSRRPEHYIHFPPIDTKDGDDSDNDEDKLIKVELNRSESRIPDKWAAFGTGKNVYVEVNCVPAASISLNGPIEVYAIAGDCLELKGGALRVTGLTLLPPGRLFLLLCMKSFGLHPLSSSYGDEDEELDQCLGWLGSNSGMAETKSVEDNSAERVLRAIEFHDDCKNLGENLKCYPDLVIKLLSIFDSVDGYQCSAWEDLHCNNFVEIDESAHRYKQSASYRRGKEVSRQNIPVVERVSNRGSAPNPGGTESKKLKKKKSDKKQNQLSTPQALILQLEQDVTKKISTPADKKMPAQATLVTRFNKKAKKNAAPLFAVTMDDSSVAQSDLPSTNILSMLVDSYRKVIKKSRKTSKTSPEGAAPIPDQWAVYSQITTVDSVQEDTPVSLAPSQWRVYKVPGKNGRDWFAATFVGSQISLRPLKGKGNAPAWMKLELTHPSKPKDAKQCVPPHFAPRLTFWQTKVVRNECSVEEEMLLYPTLETALRMGAAYWLERQFFDEQRHWYQISFDAMMELCTLS